MFVASYARLPPGFRFHLGVNVQIFPCNALYRVFAVTIKLWVGSGPSITVRGTTSVPLHYGSGPLLQCVVPPRYTARALYYNARKGLGTARALYCNARYRLGTASEPLGPSIAMRGKASVPLGPSITVRGTASVPLGPSITMHGTDIQIAFYKVLIGSE